MQNATPKRGSRSGPIFQPSPIRRLTRAAALTGLTMLGLSGVAAQAAELQEPQVLASVGGVLDLLMVAQPSTLTTLTPQKPEGFTYSVCRRPTNGAQVCPPAPPGTIPYAGPRLSLLPGDTLKIHLINKLPPLTDSKHAVNPEEQNPSHAYLALNPTNIHTHGLLVSPHYPSATDPTYGDNIYVMTFNSANGTPSFTAAMHADVRMDATDYSIKIPANHPSGLYWIHPHVHGIALNQISSGLAGMLTVGAVSDYVCNNANCASFASQLNIRHINFKDLQVLGNGQRYDQPDPAMCLSPTTGGLVTPASQGFCPGQNFSANGGPDYTGAKWFFPVNGQPFPTITVAQQGGEIWRMLNASGSITYNLSLRETARNANMVFQILSIDGVSVDGGANANGGRRFRAVACPGLGAAANGDAPAPTCADQLLMMPSSRVEIWVAYRDASGRITTPPNGATAILETAGFNSGPAGDTWPAVQLAQVNFPQSPAVNAPAYLTVSAPPASLSNPLQLSQDINQASANAGVNPANCAPLAAGHRRRVYFNVPSDYADLFGLGYEEVDQNGTPVPGTFVDVHEFNSATPTVCLPLGTDNAAVTERWELVNLAGEDHNFHIHQTKFKVVSMPTQNGTSIQAGNNGQPVLLDNIPVVHATGGSSAVSSGGCASVSEWKNGACNSTPTVVDIPFYVAGDYVYHCHILEHEDGGMMARIRVLAKQ